MKHLQFVLLLSLILISCKEKQQKESSLSTKLDTIFLKDKEVLFISPSENSINFLKKKYSEDFYTIADDAHNYFSIATEYLDSLKVRYQSFDDDKIIGFRAQNKFIPLPKYKSPWNAVLYSSGKYKIVDLTDFRNEFMLFFKEQNKIKDEANLKNWYGLYLNSDSKDLYKYTSITDKIGWYKLSISEKEIIFESDRRMESEFPTEAPGGVYVNYKCDYKIMGDTIRLYEKLTNVDSIPHNISGNDPSQPGLVLYKKGGKYYGFSDDISESENLNNAIRAKNKSPYLFMKFNE